MAGIAREALHKLYDFNPQGLANTLWAFATLNHYGEQYGDLLSGIALEAMKKIQNFNPQVSPPAPCCTHLFLTQLVPHPSIWKT